MSGLGCWVSLLLNPFLKIGVCANEHAPGFLDLFGQFVKATFTNAFSKSSHLFLEEGVGIV